MSLTSAAPPRTPKWRSGRSRSLPTSTHAAHLLGLPDFRGRQHPLYPQITCLLTFRARLEAAQMQSDSGGVRHGAVTNLIEGEEHSQRPSVCLPPHMDVVAWTQVKGWSRHLRLLLHFGEGGRPSAPPRGGFASSNAQTHAGPSPLPPSGVQKSALLAEAWQRFAHKSGGPTRNLRQHGSTYLCTGKSQGGCKARPVCS